MRRWLTLAFVLLWTAVAMAQPPEPRLQWTHDGIGVTRFECVIDSGTPANLGLPTPVGATYTVFLSACGTLTVSAHLLVVNACDESSCTASSPLTVVKL